MFDGVTCGHSKSSNTIFKLLYVKDTLESCLNGTEVKKVTTSGPGKNEQYCGKHISLSISISISLYLLLIVHHYKLYQHDIQKEIFFRQDYSIDPVSFRF